MNMEHLVARKLTGRNRNIKVQTLLIATLPITNLMQTALWENPHLHSGAGGGLRLTVLEKRPNT